MRRRERGGVNIHARGGLFPVQGAPRTYFRFHLAGHHGLQLGVPGGVGGDEILLQQVLARFDILLCHGQAALFGNGVLVQVAGAHAQPLDVWRRQGCRVVAHGLGPGHVHGEDLQPVRVGIHQPQHGDAQGHLDLAQEQACGDVWLTLGRNDDAGVLVVEPVFCQAHEGGVLLHQQHELRV